MAINVKICNKQAIADLGDGGTAALVLAGENKYSLKRWSDQRKRFQQIFCAAYNSASRDGLNDNQAHQVAWNSVKNSYEEGIIWRYLGYKPTKSASTPLLSDPVR
ncbi:ChaB family protein [Coleofasciculus sp. G2-EDA-02]|uniref:ChaB family protein n=1 Tax=Coleofasciculus sp. G2-EDA-02 TaxID=3069529 RepID=UPI0032F1C2AB